jgi:regulator of replication initiation timing
MKVMLLTRQLDEAWRQARRNGRELEDVLAASAVQEDTIAELQEQLQVSEEVAQLLMQENTKLRAELSQARAMIVEILEQTPPDVRPLAEALPGEDNKHLRRFLAEWLRLADVPVCQRRYSEAMYELAFILHRTSPAGYEVLREILALPARSCLQLHFRVILDLEMKRLSDVGEAERAVRDHMRKHNVQTVMPEEVVLACDATGLSASCQGEHAGYCFAFGVLFLNPEIPDLWLHVARRDTGSLSQVEVVEAELSAACEAAGLHVAVHATDGDRAADKRHTHKHSASTLMRWGRRRSRRSWTTWSTVSMAARGSFSTGSR